MALKIKVATVQNWINRRKRKHKSFTSDDVWNQINSKWPNLSQQDREAIFQGVAM